MCNHKGLGLSQQARFGKSGSDPDRNTACQFWNSPYGPCLPGTGSWTVQRENPHTLTGMHCLPSTERLAKQDVDGWKRQPISDVLTVQICVDIFVSVLKKASSGNQKWSDSLPGLSPEWGELSAYIEYLSDRIDIVGCSWGSHRLFDCRVT